MVDTKGKSNVLKDLKVDTNGNNNFFEAKERKKGWPLEDRRRRDYVSPAGLTLQKSCGGEDGRSCTGTSDKLRN